MSLTRLWPWIKKAAREIEASGEPLMVRGFALPLPAPDMRSPFLKRRLPRRPPPLEEIIPLERRAKAQMPQARRWRKPIGVLEIIVRGETIGLLGISERNLQYLERLAIRILERQYPDATGRLYWHRRGALKAVRQSTDSSRAGGVLKSSKCMV